MTSSDFVSRFAMLTSCSRHELDRIAGYLRKARLIPVGARGLNAPDLQPHDAANLFIGLVASARPKDAVQVVPRYSALKADDKCTSFPFQFDGDTFGQAVEEIFGTASLAYKVEKVELCRIRPEATIRLKVNDKEYGYVYETEQANRDRPYIRNFIIIDGAVIHQLCLDLKKSS
jgi:hypothetical protein